jgi:hypothetical protein
MYIVTKVVFVSKEAPYDGEFDFSTSDPACRLGSYMVHGLAPHWQLRLALAVCS